MNDEIKKFNEKLQEIDSNFYSKFNELENINDILDYKKNILNILSSYKKKIDDIKNLLNLIEKKLYLECKHKWIRDYTYYGEHSQFTCSECKIYK